MRKSSVAKYLLPGRVAFAGRQKPCTGFGRPRQQAGDTIVEVLIAIAVISLVLVGAYVSTNKNINSTQDAQERSQAVQLVQTQIEYLRKAGSITTGNCFDNSGKEQTFGGSPGANPCIVTTDGTMAAAATEPAYTLRIQSVAPNIYSVSAVWDSLMSSTKDNVTMYYQP